MNKKYIMVFILIFSIFIFGCGNIINKECSIPASGGMVYVDAIRFEMYETVGIIHYVLYNFGNTSAIDVKLKCTILNDENNYIFEFEEIYNIPGNAMLIDDFIIVNNVDEIRQQRQNQTNFVICNIENCDGCINLNNNIESVLKGLQY